MILTDIGEVGIETGGKLYKLRPSLYAMTQIGDPGEIVAVFASVMSSPSLADVLAVCNACCEDDVSGLFGHVVPARAGRGLRYAPGKVPIPKMVHIARSLLRHGVTGALEPLPRKPGDDPGFVKEFDARAHVALAMAHLGATSDQAWAMTMTELVGALRAKFPPVESPKKTPTIEEHDATMAWFAGVEAVMKSRG